jgi:hypothetical protein
MKGQTAKTDSHHGQTNLTMLEEEAMVKNVLDQDSQGFSPRSAEVGDMANLLLQKHSARPVGRNWPNRCIARFLELKTQFNRVYDY